MACFSDTAYVRILISDVNDNAPMFSRPVYEISIDEDMDVGYVVLIPTASDKDEGRTTSFFKSMVNNLN